jgi:hypothetical protein
MAAENLENSRLALCIDNDALVLQHQYQWCAMSEMLRLLCHACAVAQLMVNYLCIMCTAK